MWDLPPVLQEMYLILLVCMYNLSSEIIRVKIHQKSYACNFDKYFQITLHRGIIDPLTFFFFYLVFERLKHTLEMDKTSKLPWIGSKVLGPQES